MEAKTHQVRAASEPLLVETGWLTEVLLLQCGWFILGFQPERKQRVSAVIGELVLMESILLVVFRNLKAPFWMSCHLPT